MVQTSILTTPSSAFWFSSRYKLRPSFSVWEALPVSPRDSCTCSVRVSAHVCKLCFMCSIGATHQILLQFKSPRLWGESPLKSWSTELDLHWKSATHFNVSPFLVLISLFFSDSFSQQFYNLQLWILDCLKPEPFLPTQTPMILTNQPRVFPEAQLFWSTIDSFDSSILAPLPASQPLLPLPRWHEEKALRIQQRSKHDMTGFPTKFPTCLSPVRLIMASSSLASCPWANHKELLSRGHGQRRDSCSLGFECSCLQHHSWWTRDYTNLVPWSNWNTNRRWTEDSSRMLATSQTPENPPKFISFYVTLRPSDDANYLVPICNLPDPIWEHHGHHCIETPLHCHVGIYHLNVEDSSKTHCWTTWLFLFDKINRKNWTEKSISLQIEHRRWLASCPMFAAPKDWVIRTTFNAATFFLSPARRKDTRASWNGSECRS